MSTLTMTTGAGAVTGSFFYVFDTNTKEFKKENARNLVLTTLATGALAAGAKTINNKYLDKIHREYKSASSYVDSMSDEQLAAALQRMDLLLSEEETTEDVKTL